MKSSGLLVIIALPLTLFAVLPVSGFGATAWYVTPTGAGSFSGTSWGNAFSHVQDAVDAATNSGDTVYLRHGTYTNNAQIEVLNAPGLTVAGGYVGESGTPGPLTNAPTILTRGLATNRILYANASTVVLERVTVRGGKAVSDDGGGLKLINCAVTISNCVVANNGLGGGGVHYGGGIYAVGGSLKIARTDLESNYAVNDLNDSHMYGGGLACSGVALSLTNCTVTGNYCSRANTEINSHGYGGGLSVNQGTVDVSDCTFSDNYVYETVHWWGKAYGGAVYAKDVDSLQVRSSGFSGNYVHHSSSYGHPTDRYGGVLYKDGGQAVLTSCRIAGNGRGYRGDICQRGVGGTLVLTNCVVAQNAGDGVHQSRGSLYAENCTFAGNSGWGVKVDETHATAALRNSIAWGNGSGGISTGTVTYTCSQEAHSGAGNLSTDPLFGNAAAAEYHLKSMAGSWRDGLDRFVRYATNSPCIDAGDPTSPYFLEPASNGSRINMGAYGNTPHASKTGSVPPPANTWYVTPTGGGTFNGTSWPNAFGSVQDAVDVATNDGDSICLKYGTYTNEAEIEVDHALGLSIEGGYLGVGHTVTNAPSVLARGAANARILDAYASDFDLARLTIRDGRLENDHGAGLNLLYCCTVVSNCVVTDNRIVVTVGDYNSYYGGGVYASGGSLSLCDTDILNNRVIRGASWLNYYPRGGGLACHFVGLSLSNCVVSGNYLESLDLYCNVWSYGGGVYVNGGAVRVADSRFDSNYVDSRSYWYGCSRGGALCAQNVDPLEVLSTTFTCNRVYHLSANYGEAMEGGSLYVEGGTAAVSLSRVYGNGGGAWMGDIWSWSCAFRMTNCLVANNCGSGVRVTYETLGVDNCTFADNTGWGLDGVNAALTVKNSIAWDNGEGAIETNGSVTVTYSCSQELIAGAGNVCEDPLFVDTAAGDYHLKGMGGAWRDDLQAFRSHRVNSPCIDAGDPASPYDREFLKNGGRVNMGAYGNTCYASSRFPGATVLWIK